MCPKCGRSDDKWQWSDRKLIEGGRVEVLGSSGITLESEKWNSAESCQYLKLCKEPDHCIYIKFKSLMMRSDIISYSQVRYSDPILKILSKIQFIDIYQWESKKVWWNKYLDDCQYWKEMVFSGNSIFQVEELQASTINNTMQIKST